MTEQEAQEKQAALHVQLGEKVYLRWLLDAEIDHLNKTILTLNQEYAASKVVVEPPKKGE